MPTVLYEQVKQSVLALIERDGLVPGDRLPTEMELLDRFRVSRITVSRALRELTEAGLIERRQGVGTFVARPKVLVDLQRLKSFSEDMLLRGFRPGGRILRIAEVTPPKEVQRALHVKANARLQVIVRLRAANREPIGLHEAYLHPHLRVTERELAQRGSLYAVLWDRWHITLAEADETIEAVTAAGSVASLLNVGRNAPLLQVKRISYDQRHRPTEFVRMLYRADRYQYFTKLRA